MILYFFLVISELTHVATAVIQVLFKHDEPRHQGKVVHKLFEILFLTISAVIAGCELTGHIWTYLPRVGDFLWNKKAMASLYDRVSA
jgi:hypothetical protein